jgi:cysteine-rich repeat protein
MAYVHFGADLFSGLYDAVKNLELEVPGGSRTFHGGSVDAAFEFDPATKTIEAIPWDAHDTSIAATDDGHTTYTLPFTLPWFGRAITALDVNTNGLVELLEAGESCSECAAPLTHFAGRHVSGHLDAVFAANDDLQTQVVISGSSDLVTIHWVGSTKLDANFESDPVAVEVLLFPDGRVHWKLFDLKYAARSGDLFSGIYDGGRDVAEEVFDGSTAFDDTALHRALAFAGAAEGPPGGPRCTNGIDDDGDDLVDAADPDCHGCGDGQPDPGEACDDGNATNGDGCDTNCTVSACGNAVRAPDEECDPAAEPTGCGRHQLCRAADSANPCTCFAILDHFLGYATKLTRGSLCTAAAPQNAGGICADEIACGGTVGITDFCAANKPAKNLSVVLVSALTNATYLVQKPAVLDTPADVKGDTVGDADVDLRGYAIKASSKRCAAQAPQNGSRACRQEDDCGGTRHVTSFCVTQPKPGPTTAIVVTNVLHPHGELTIDALTLNRLLVPAATSFIAPVDPLDSAHTVDRFACAMVQPSKGAAKFPKHVQATVADQLGPPVVYDLKKPTHLCAPAGVNGAGVADPTTFLMCYQAKPAKGQLGHPATNGIFVTHELGRERVDALKEEELCLRSTTSLP